MVVLQLVGLLIATCEMGDKCVVTFVGKCNGVCLRAFLLMSEIVGRGSAVFLFSSLFLV